MNEQLDLIKIEQSKAEVYFAPGGAKTLIDIMRESLKDFKPDVSTKKGRDEIASRAYRVSQAKTKIDNIGKSLVEGEKKRLALIDAERKYLRDEADKLRDETRKPLTDWENAEKERIAILKEGLNDIKKLSIAIDEFGNEFSADQLREKYAKAKSVKIDDSWQEFKADAAEAKDSVVTSLESAIEKRQKYEDEQAELKRLREEREEKERIEREEKIRREAAEKAKKEAEDKAKREAEDQARKQREELERVEAEKRREMEARIEADRKAKEAEEQAALRAEQAAHRERDRIAAEKKAEEEEAARREADEKHRSQVNNQIFSAMQALGVERATAIKLVLAIRDGKIPFVKINY